MKKSFAVGFSLFVATITWGQGSVHFGNTATTLITTNDFQGHIGNIVGAGNYGFGLYLGSFGSSGDALTLTALATNGAFPGRFDGGNLVPLSPGMQFSFQVRGWSSFAGASYEQAYINAINGSEPSAFLGESTVGFFTAPTAGTIELFGTGPGQVGGFALTPLPIPEPSTYALAGLGLCSLLLLWRRKRARA
jgi:hypothetical protein